MKFGFIVLNYKNSYLTTECVNSIMDKFDIYDIEICIVDNGGFDYDLLLKKFNNFKKIKILKTNKNVGFARANNLGYKQIRSTCDFIIICNNDIEFIDDSFLNSICELYDKYNYDVYGPDIINLKGKHTNPLFDKMLTKQEIKALIKTTRIKPFKNNVIIKKLIHFKNILVKKKETKHNKKIIKHSENCVIHGSCIVFSKKWLIGQNYAFNNQTFMFGEELLLRNTIDKENRKMIYDDKTQVLHKESATIKEKYGDNYLKKRFYCKNLVRSLKILLKNM